MRLDDVSRLGELLTAVRAAPTGDFFGPPLA